MYKSETLTIHGTRARSPVSQELSNQNASEFTSGSLTYRPHEEPVPMTLEIRNFTASSLQTEQVEGPGSAVNLPRRTLEMLNIAIAGEHDLPEEL